jgi:hypothetical protein
MFAASLVVTMSSTSANAATGVPSTSTTNKRKLSTSAEDGRQSAPPPPPPPHSAHVAPGGSPLINYLVKSSPERLRLIHGDDDTFKDVLEMINKYEGMFMFLCIGTCPDVRLAKHSTWVRFSQCSGTCPDN